MLTNDYLPIQDVAARFRRSPECVRLWITKGILVEGSRCFLKAIKVGGAWLISDTDLREFLDKPLRQQGREAS